MKNAKSYLLSALFAHMASVRRSLGWYAGRTGTPPRPKRRRPPISGTSWRQLKRAVARGIVTPRPATLEAAMRHKWFQKAAYFAALRCKLGQGTSGDKELVDAIGAFLRRNAQRQHRQGAPA